MVKLNKILSQLEKAIEKIEEQIEDIYCRADEKNRDTTEREEEHIEALQLEIEDIRGAIDYIAEYCE